VFADMELTKASVHDLQYLNEIKHSGLNNCLLLADKGYISREWKIDLFSSAGIVLETPKKSNQKDYQPWPPIFHNTRKRVEVYFAQLCDQMMLKRNYAKSFEGLRTRIISKISSATLLQHINTINGKPINHIKHALAA
jgi:hypothetical protein